MKIENNMKCDICGSDIKNFISLGLHIRYNHIEYNMQRYYDTFLLKDKSKKCKYCGKELSFKGLSKGYGQFCSNDCSNKSEETKSKYKQKMMKKYGVDNSFKAKEVKNQIKETNIEKYGNGMFLQSETGLEKTKESLISKYGVDHFSKTDIFKTILSQKCYWKTEESRLKLNDIINKKKINTIIKRSNLNINVINVNKDWIKFYCSDCCEIIEMSVQMFHRRYRNNEVICCNCNKYHKPISTYETDLVNFIKTNYDDLILTNKRNVISHMELDIYLPKLKLAFEFNGLYWHSELYKEKKYHINKTELCEEKGIHLVHVYEDEWVNKQDIIKSKILNLLNKSNVIYARKCDLRIVTYKNSKEFLNDNHLQGNCNNKIRLGLYYENVLVSLMIFKKLSNYKKCVYEMLRFCNKLNVTVIGGAEKLFKYFLKKYIFIEVISYADRSWTMNNQNNLYDKLEFECISKINPSYYYIINKYRINKFNFHKDILVKENYDVNKSEHEIMLEKNIYRIYDSGQLKYIYRRK